MSDESPQPAASEVGPAADPAPETAPGPRSDAKALAEAQQHLLERDLKIADLARALDVAQTDRAHLTEQVRRLEAALGRRLRSRLKQRVKAELAAVRATAPPVHVPLSSLPVALGSDRPHWHLDVDVAGSRRAAIHADPPAAYRWEIDLPTGSELLGSVALRPAAWDANHGGIDLIVEVQNGAGELVASLTQAVDPSARADDRRWLEWRLPIPVSAATGRHRITLRTAVAAEASPDYAWAVLADLRVVLTEAAPRTQAEPTGPRALLRDVARRARPGAGTPLVPDGPTISLLLPVHDPEPGLLDRTLAAVLAQTTDRWELCIVDDGSADPLVRDRLARAAQDGRVKLTRHERAGGISAATNAALALATGEFVATLDHDDLLAPDAIASVRAYLAGHPETDLVYSDNDLLAGDRRFAAALKPDWSPDLLRSVMYTLHFSAYRRSAVEAAGGWRTAFDGAQDHDLVLRLSEATDRIGHLPRVLYHWRAHAGSAALGELAKPLAYERGREAIAEHLSRTGHAGAKVSRLSGAGRYRVSYPRTAPVTVVAGIPDGLDARAVHDATAAILAVLRDDDRLLLATAAGIPAGDHADAAASALADGRLGVEPAPADAGRPGDHVAAVIAVAAQVPTSHTLVLMEVVVAPADARAIDDLAGHVEAGAAVAGGVVAGDEGRLLAGAVDFPAGLPMPAHPDASLDDADRHPALTVASNRLAVRGVVAMPARALAGLRPAAAPLTGLAVVGLTLEASRTGGRLVWSPHARFEAAPGAAAALLTWPLVDVVGLDRGTDPDPYWNPQRWADRGDATIPEGVHGAPLLDEVQA